MQVVPDPNVLVSAAVGPDGVCSDLFRRLVESAFEIVVSPMLLAETSRVLSRPHFEWTEQVDRGKFAELVRRVSRLEPDPPAPDDVLVPADPTDDYLVRLVLASPDRILVSGDPHLLALAGTHPVMSPRTLLHRLIVVERQHEDSGYRARPRA